MADQTIIIQEEVRAALFGAPDNSGPDARRLLLRTQPDGTLRVAIVDAGSGGRNILGARRVLGQSAPLAATETVVYTVPALTSAEVGVTMANRSSTTDAVVRLGVSVGGGALAIADYLYYNTVIPYGTALVHDALITLGPADEVRAYTDGAILSVNVFGYTYT